MTLPTLCTACNHVAYLTPKAITRQRLQYGGRTYHHGCEPELLREETQ